VKKMDGRRMLTAPLAVVVLLVILAGCGHSRFQLGWVESNQPGRFGASYATFSGSEIRTVRVGDGQTLLLKYKVEVDKGAVTFRVEGPDARVLWHTTLSGDTQDAVELRVDEAGRCAIIVRGDGAGGSFDLSWEVQ
jgi:hypothetical protein